MQLQYPQWTQFEKCNLEIVIGQEFSETILFGFNSLKKQTQFFKDFCLLFIYIILPILEA